MLNSSSCTVPRRSYLTTKSATRGTPNKFRANFMNYTTGDKLVGQTLATRLHILIDHVAITASVGITCQKNKYTHTHTHLCVRHWRKKLTQWQDYHTSPFHRPKFPSGQVFKVYINVLVFNNLLFHKPSAYFPVTEIWKKCSNTFYEIHNDILSLS